MSRIRIDLPALKAELRALRLRMSAAAGVEQERLLVQVEDLRDRLALAQMRRSSGERQRRLVSKRTFNPVHVR